MPSNLLTKDILKLILNANTKQKIKTNIRITVEDTGIGVPKDKLALIFERFTQAESHYSRRFGGVGLGLAISKQLIEAMGGSIHVKSQPGKGSKFWFDLSLNLSKTMNASVKEIKAPYDVERFQSLR